MNIKIETTKYYCKIEKTLMWTDAKYIDIDTNDYVIFRDSILTLGFILHKAQIEDTKFRMTDDGFFKKEGRGKAKKSHLDKIKYIQYMEKDDLEETIEEKYI